MNRAIKRVATAVIVMLLLLVGQLTYLQVIDAKELADDPRNSRTYLRDFTRPRGEIVSADGKILARSIPSNDEYELQRVYPLRRALLPDRRLPVGRRRQHRGREGVHRRARRPERSSLELRDIGDLLLGKKQTGNVRAQPAHRRAARGQGGARQPAGLRRGDRPEDRRRSSRCTPTRASIRPRWPVTTRRSCRPTSTLLVNATRRTRCSRARTGSGTHPDRRSRSSRPKARSTPGSRLRRRCSRRVRSFTAPQAGRAIQNFGGSSCGGTLEESFIHSCNTTFAALGLQLGEQFPPHMAGFGIYEQPPLDLSPGAAVEHRPAARDVQRQQAAVRAGGHRSG